MASLEILLSQAILKTADCWTFPQPKKILPMVELGCPAVSSKSSSFIRWCSIKRIELTITALSPLAIGKQKPGGSINEVEKYIPGSVLRGAIAKHILHRAGMELENLAANGGLLTIKSVQVARFRPKFT